MKRIFVCLLALAMLLALTACGAEPAADSASVSAPEPAVSVSAEETAEPSETPAPASDTPEEPADSVGEPAAEASPVVAGEETVIVDDENCTFKITGEDPDGLFGYTWNVFLENKTETSLMFCLDEVSVNGVMCDPFWASAIPAGTQSNEEISWDSEDFDRSSITDVTVVEFKLRVYDDEDWEIDYLVDQVFKFYPKGEDAVRTETYTPKDSDIVLFDNDSCTMIVTGFDPDNIWGYTMNAYLLNKTDSTLMFSIDGASVNGMLCDPFWACTVSPGKAAFQAISWNSDEFTENNITEVRHLELPVTVYNSEDFTAEDLVSETFTIDP